MEKSSQYTVRSVLVSFLSKNGYAGLYSDIYGCGCDLSELIPCDGLDISQCKPRYKVNCINDGQHDFDIQPEMQNMEKTGLILCEYCDKAAVYTCNSCDAPMCHDHEIMDLCEVCDREERESE